ncbi:MAG TPA: PqqD family protein [Gaiellaceae bacterium]|nr:PqqD family protein [Gaiellaceae bacterium]
MAFDPTSKLEKNENVAFRRLAEGEGGVLLHLETGEYHGINEVGSLIWELLDGERTVGEVAVALRDAVEDPPSDMSGEVISFLDRLRKRDLVR